MRLNRWIAAMTAAVALAVAPAKSHAGVFVNISIAPPAIPVYEQPICPGPDYIWTPGYWQWDAEVADYYWIPGTWVAAPQPGYLWTPGYWAFDGGYYGWRPGYWGSHIGYYGGVNYGFGYFGRGYEGGYWNRDHFYYNTAISRVNVVNVHNTYVHNVTVVNNVHTSYVGGSGLQSRPTGGELAAVRENHLQPTGVQMQHATFARQDRAQFAQVNHGAPQAAALARPANSVGSLRQGAVAGQAGGSYTPGAGQQRGFAGGNGSVQQRGAGQNGQGQPSSPGQFGNRAPVNGAGGVSGVGSGRGTYGTPSAPVQPQQRQPYQPQVPGQQPQQRQTYQPQVQPPSQPQGQVQPQQRQAYQPQGQQPRQQQYQPQGQVQPQQRQTYQPQVQPPSQPQRQPSQPQAQPRTEARPAAENRGGGEREDRHR